MLTLPASPVDSAARLRDRPIAVFDSGLGGLTVLKALREALPNENLVYLGDTARVPYGTKSASTVARYAAEVVSALTRQPIKMLIIACNTVSAVALGALVDAVDPTGTVPVLGVIGPSAHGALRPLEGALAGPALRAGRRRIGVIGTEGTIRRGAYQRALTGLNPGVAVHALPCPLFVPLVEEGLLTGEIPRLIAERYLAPLKAFGPDTLILGCTHYPLLRGILAEVMGPGVQIVDSADPTAREARAILEARGLLREAPDPGHVRFMVTDAPSRFQAVGQGFLGAPIDAVSLIDLATGEIREVSA